MHASAYCFGSEILKKLILQRRANASKGLDLLGSFDNWVKI
jgi:hypothetical protein